MKLLRRDWYRCMERRDYEMTQADIDEVNETIKSRLPQGTEFTPLTTQQVEDYVYDYFNLDDDGEDTILQDFGDGKGAHPVHLRVYVGEMIEDKVFVAPVVFNERKEYVDWDTEVRR